MVLTNEKKRHLVLDLIAQRRDTYDNLMWQMPLLLLTGLSALLAVTLGHENYTSCKRTAAALGILMSLGTYHSYVRFKFCEEFDGIYIDQKMSSRMDRNYAPPFAGSLFVLRNRAFEEQEDLSPILKLPFFQRKTHELWGFIEFCLIYTNFILFMATWCEDIDNNKILLIIAGFIVALLADLLKFYNEKYFPKPRPNNPNPPKKDVNDSTIPLPQPDNGGEDDEWMEQAIRIIADRRKSYDTLLWQMPTVAFTGIAFLLNVSFTIDYTTTNRLVSSILGVLITLGTLNFFARLRYFEFYDSDYLIRHLTIPGDNEPVLFGIQLRNERNKHIEKRLLEVGFWFPKFYQIPSFKFWNFLLIMLFVANASVIYSIACDLEECLFEVFLVLGLLLYAMLRGERMWISHDRVKKVSDWYIVTRVLFALMFYDYMLFLCYFGDHFKSVAGWKLDSHRTK